MKVLLVEDDTNLSEMLKLVLKRKGFEVDTAIDGEEAYDKIYKNSYDVLVLDWMMPRLDGLSLAKKLRQEGANEKILMLTAKDSSENKVLGLNSGVDDYVVKPFEIDELVARINALGRRFNNYIEAVENFKDLTINRNKKTIKTPFSEEQFTSREFAIFELLFRNKGTVLPRELIIDKIWGFENEISQNNLDAYIKLLRKKLKKLTDEDIIKTVRGIGYKI